jgi:hypothetical protein
MTCEDFPCCGHEQGDCEGQKYGSDQDIKKQVEEAWATGHGYCEHAAGIYNCEPQDQDDDSEDKEEPVVQYARTCPITTPEPHELGEFPMTCHACHAEVNS